MGKKGSNEEVVKNKNKSTTATKTKTSTKAKTATKKTADKKENRVKKVVSKKENKNDKIVQEEVQENYVVSKNDFVEQNQTTENRARSGRIRNAVAAVAMGVGLLLSGIGIGSLITTSKGNNNTVWLSGFSTPLATEGKNGDFYYDTDDKVMYQKTNNQWEVVVNLSETSQLQSGISAPNEQTGKIGDHYIDLKTYNLYKKENNGWVNIGSIKGKAGASFLSGATKPTASEGDIGDVYLDMKTYNMYEKTESGWKVTVNINPDGSEERPYMIYNATDILELANEATCTYYRLANDIDLNEIENAYATSDSLLESINCEIDGNGYRIIMHKVGKVATGGNYGIVARKATGKLKNVTLHFDNIVGNEITFCYTGENMTFENVITTGSISIPNTSNYSPLVSFCKTSLSFIGCTSNINIGGPVKFGSPFLGGYLLGGTKVGTTSAGTKILDGVELVFKDCTNNGTVESEHVGLLCGNPNTIPLIENLTIENIVNNGRVVGTIAAGEWASWSLPYVELDEYNNKVKSQLSGTGVVEMKTLQGLSVSHNETTRKITIVNTADEGQYKYELSLMVFLSVEGGSSVVVSTMQVSLGEIEKYGFYKYIDKNKLEELETLGATKEEITENNVVIKQNSGKDAKLYFVTYNNGNSVEYYYYVELDNGEYEYTISNSDDMFSYVVTVKDAGNKVVAQVRKFW